MTFEIHSVQRNFPSVRFAWLLHRCYRSHSDGFEFEVRVSRKIFVNA